MLQENGMWGTGQGETEVEAAKNMHSEGGSDHIHNEGSSNS